MNKTGFTIILKKKSVVTIPPLSNYILFYRLISLYYSGGDVCDLTNRPRFVEVKLK